jgi:hypothetical protein
MSILSQIETVEKGSEQISLRNAQKSGFAIWSKIEDLWLGNGKMTPKKSVNVQRLFSTVSFGWDFVIPVSSFRFYDLEVKSLWILILQE